MLPDPPEGLRHWRAADAADLVAAWTDPEIVRWNRPPTERDLDAARRWIAGAEARWARRSALDLVIDGPGGEVAGEVGLRNLTGGPEQGGPARGELSVWVLPAHRTDGRATRAVPTLVEMATSRLELVQVWARVHVDNGAAQALFAALGWTQLGTSGPMTVLVAPPPTLA